jgi:hypothetical protein
VAQFSNAAAAELSEYALLHQVLQKQFEVTVEEGDDTLSTVATPHEPDDMPYDDVTNPADPDASYNAHKGLGYMAPIAETYAEDDGPAYETTSGPPDLFPHMAGRGMAVQGTLSCADREIWRIIRAPSIHANTGQKAEIATLQKAATHSEKSIAGGQASQRQCHGRNIR